MLQIILASLESKVVQQTKSIMFHVYMVLKIPLCPRDLYFRSPILSLSKYNSTLWSKRMRNILLEFMWYSSSFLARQGGPRTWIKIASEIDLLYSNLEVELRFTISPQLRETLARSNLKTNLKSRYLNFVLAILLAKQDHHLQSWIVGST